MEVALAYNQRTSLVNTLTDSALDFAINMRRPPVSFRGRVKEPVLLRQLMGALHEVILSDMRWVSDEEFFAMLDPVITVHHDQLFFEAFSNDESSYARLSAPLAAFEPEGEVLYGTTNIDFTYQLRSALNSLRSSRRTVFAVGAGGFGVTTTGPATRAHFERKVDLPDSWLKGFLQVQSALTMKPYLFDVRPADLLTVIAFLEEHKARVPPRGLRFEFTPDAPITLVLEPWEERFKLKDTHYSGYARTVRLWGRKRLSLLRYVLPYAQRVTVGVLGRGLPHCYICHCGNYQFALVLSGWTGNDWSKGSAFDLLAPAASLDAERVAMVYNVLMQHLAAEQPRVVADTALSSQEVDQALFELCRAGRAIYDPTTRRYRLRELFPEPLDSARLFTPDPRISTARRLLESGRVTLQQITRPGDAGNFRRELRATATVQDDDGRYDVIAAVDGEARLRFGRCTCAFFDQNLMARGPCEHILAARFALENQASSAAAPTEK